jgi:hypothetical protein
MIDIIGEILWFAIFVTAVITLPLAYKYYTSNKKKIRVIAGIFLALT